MSERTSLNYLGWMSSHTVVVIMTQIFLIKHRSLSIFSFYRQSKYFGDSECSGFVGSFQPEPE